MADDFDYDALYDNLDGIALRNAARTATGVNPDTEAENRRLAKQYGIPLVAMETQREEVLKRAQADAIATLAGTRTGHYLAKPENAKIAHDDIEPMTVLENLLMAPRAIGAGVVSINRGVYGVLATGAGLVGAKGAQAAFQAGAKGAGDMADAVQGQEGQNWFARMFQGAMKSTGANAPGLAATLATKNPAFALGGAGVTAGGESAARALEAGKSPARAALYGGVDAGYEMLFERLPLGELLKSLGGGEGLVKTLGKQMFVEVPTEIATTLAQNLNEWTQLNPDKPFAAWLKEQPQAVIDTIAQTVIQTGATTTLAHTADRAAKAVERHEQRKLATERAQAEAKMLGDLAKTAKASKLRERAPASFQEFVDEAAAGGDAENVWFSPAEAAKAGVDLNQLAEALPSLSDQLAEALAVGGDVKVPIGEFAATAPEIADSQALLDHLKLDPSGMSKAQAEAWLTTEGDALKAQTEKVIAEAVDHDAFETSVKVARDRVFAELSAAGAYSPDVNARMADLHGHFVAVNAQRAGLTPEEFDARYRLNVGGGEVMGAPQPGVLDQRTDTPEFKAWFGESKLVDEAGGALQLYHGTADDIEAFDLDHSNRKDSGWLGTGVYLTDRRELANMYANAKRKGDDGRNVMPLFARVENPYLATLEDKQRLRDLGREGADAFTAELKAKGHDGVILAYPDGTREVVVFDPAAVKSSTGNVGTFDRNDPNVLKQEGGYDPGAGMRSTLYEAAQKGPNKATAKQWLATLQNTPGVKKEELEWVGLPEYLATVAEQQGEAELGGSNGAPKEASIAKEDVLAFIEQNGVVLDVIELGEGGDGGIDYESDAYSMREVELRDEAFEQDYEAPDFTVVLGRADGGTVALNDAPELDEDGEPIPVEPDPEADLPPGPPNVELFPGQELGRDPNAPKYFIVIDDGELDSGYAELVAGPFETQLEADRARVDAEDQHREQARDDFDTPDWVFARLEEEFENSTQTKFSQYKMPGGDNYREVLIRLPTEDNVKIKSFGGAHHDEENIVAHTRLTDRTDVDGKNVLFVEEIQSDWHQQGRKRGYAVQAKPEELKAAQEKFEAAIQTRNDLYAELKVKYRDEIARQIGDLQNIADKAKSEADQTQAAYDEFQRDLERRGIWGHNISEEDAAKGDRIQKERNDAKYKWDRIRYNSQALFQNYHVIYNDNVTSQPMTEYVNALVRLLEFQKDDASVGQDRNADIQRMHAALLTLRETDTSLAIARGEKGVPDAPFKQSWPALVVKQILRMAVEGGYDKVAWINGEQQNGGKYGGMGADSDAGWFYDRNLPNVVKDVIKKHGGKIDTVKVVPEGREWRKDMTDRPMSEEEEAEETRLLDLVAAKRAVVDTATDDAARNVAQAEWNTALNTLDKFQRASVFSPHLGFEITDEMRKAAEEGLALFQNGEPTDGSGSPQPMTKGTFNPSRLRITLTKNADLSTFLHESGHFYLHVLMDMARQPDAPAQVVEDASALLRWFKVESLDAWHAMTLEQQRTHHETFARGFELYLFEGKAPSKGLRTLFRTFRTWLTRIYREAVNLRSQMDAGMSDEVRGVMDRLLASDAAIAEARQELHALPLVRSPEEALALGMTADEWEQYQSLAARSTAEALDKLQARSVREMKWLSNARSRVLKRLQGEAKAQRQAVRAEVTAEVMAQPVYRAQQFLKRGTLDGQPYDGPHKLDVDAVAAMYEGLAPELQEWKALGFGRYGMLAREGGVHPDILAEQLGFPSGEAMVEALLNAEPMAELIAGMTDQHMLERHAELVDDRALAEAADEALHDEARLAFVAAEAQALAKATGPRKLLIDAAKDFAANMVGRLPLKEIRPHRWRAAEVRAGRAAEELHGKGQLLEAAVEKRNQLINGYAVKAAHDANRDVAKATTFFKRIAAGNDEVLARSRNMDLVNAARAVLALYGVGSARKHPLDYMRLMREYDPGLFADVQPFLEEAVANAKPFEMLTFDEFSALRDVVNQLWFMARRSKQFEIDGRLEDRRQAAESLIQRLDEIGAPDYRPGATEALTPRERAVRTLSGFRAGARRVESWARAMDGGDRGPFRRFIFERVSEAADRYRLAKIDYIGRYRDMLREIAPSLHPNRIYSAELGYTFSGKAELLHALLHTGNGSNREKLLLGRQWATVRPDKSLDTSRWDAFVERMHAEGRITEADWKFVQGVWDLLEETKVGAQRAHHQVYGRYFDEVTAEPFDTPFGPMRGGYVPALTDADLVQDAAIRRQEEALGGHASLMFPTTAKGFTKARVENYTKPLKLDLAVLGSHIDTVLKFTHFEPVVRDVTRLLKERALADRLQALDPHAVPELLLPWLNRASKQLSSRPGEGAVGRAADKFFSTLRARAGVSVMFANFVNAAQQLTGFSVTMLRVKPRHLAGGLGELMRDPSGAAARVAEASEFMRTRLSNQLNDIGRDIDDILLNPNVLEKAQTWTARHGYFLQSAFQNVVDLASWIGAYNQAQERGDDERDAIRFANSVVRETQGSLHPEDISRVEAGTAFTRLFTQFQSFFNSQANLLGTEFTHVARDLGLRRGAGRGLYVYLLGMAVPAMLTELIVTSLKGAWDDDDDDGWLDEIAERFAIGNLRYGLGLVPVAGPALNAFANTWNDKPYDDRLSTSPAIAQIEASVRAPVEVYKALFEDGDKSRAIRDTLTAVTMATGLPVSALNKPVGYAIDVAEGDVEPESGLEYARGLVGGPPPPKR